MAKKENKAAKAADKGSLREPWIRQRSGVRIVLAAGVVLAILVAINLIRGGTPWVEGILWGLGFGGSIVAVFYGMTWFHSLFNKKS